MTEPTDLPHPPTDDEMLRWCVNEFTRRLSETLKANGRGVSWRSSRMTWLLMRLRQEVEELAEAMSTGSTDVRKECLDVAAFAMMIWDLEGELGVEYGLLERVTVDKPCDPEETCRCAEAGEWPVTCYRDAGPLRKDVIP